MTRIPRRFLLLSVALTLVPGCQSGDDAIEDDLKQMGMAYVEFQLEKDESPSDWDELITYADEHGLSGEAIRRVREAGYTVTWDLATTGTEASGSTVLAQPPGEGRRLMADGGLEPEE